MFLAPDVVVGWFPSDCVAVGNDRVEPPPPDAGVEPPVTLATIPVKRSGNMCVVALLASCSDPGPGDFNASSAELSLLSSTGVPVPISKTSAPVSAACVGDAQSRSKPQLVNRTGFMATPDGAVPAKAAVSIKTPGSTPSGLAAAVTSPPLTEAAEIVNLSPL